MGDARFDAGTIEEYRERPIEFAYRTGLNHGIADGNADGRPRLFTREDCPAYRNGYIDGWATASIARKYNLDRATDEQRKYWVAEELRAITCFEAHNAECDCISDVEARESWLETVEDIARVIGGNMAKKRSLTKPGKLDSYWQLFAEFVFTENKSGTYHETMEADNGEVKKR